MNGVALHSQRHAFEQRRPAPFTGLLDRALRLEVDREDVGAVDDHATEPVGLGPVGDVLARTPAESASSTPTGCCRETNTTGSARTPAKFIASWASPRADDPSPNHATATRRSSRILNANAAPTATGSIAGRWLTIEMRPTRSSARWLLPSLPFAGPRGPGSSR